MKVRERLDLALAAAGIRIDWERFSEAAGFVLGWAVVVAFLCGIYVTVSRVAAICIASCIPVGIFLAERRDRKRWRVFVERFYSGARQQITDKEWKTFQEAPDKRKLAIHFAFDPSRPLDDTVWNAPRPQTDAQWAALAEMAGTSVENVKALSGTKPTHGPQVIPYQGGS
jgi:hypothetical protein